MNERKCGRILIWKWTLKRLYISTLSGSCGENRFKNHFALHKAIEEYKANVRKFGNLCKNDLKESDLSDLKRELTEAENNIKIVTDWQKGNFCFLLFLSFHDNYPSTKKNFRCRKFCSIKNWPAWQRSTESREKREFGAYRYFIIIECKSGQIGQTNPYFAARTITKS